MASQTVTARISDLETGYSDIKTTVDRLANTSQILSEVTSSLARKTSVADDLVSIPVRLATVIKLYEVASSQNTTITSLLAYIADNIVITPKASPVATEDNT